MTEEIELILDIAEEQMNESISRLESILSKIRAGKASPQMLSAVKVDYYGAITPLAQMANINTPDSQTISIQPFDKSVMVDIEKAILEFKYVIHVLSEKTDKINYKNIQLLSRAHHNLAIAYAKKEWYNDAIMEARKAFELIPTEENRKVMKLIQKKTEGKIKTDPK